MERRKRPRFAELFAGSSRSADDAFARGRRLAKRADRCLPEYAGLVALNCSPTSRRGSSRREAGLGFNAIDEYDHARLRLQRSDALNGAFEQSTIYTASDEQLVDHLKTICMQDVINTSVQHREVARALTINHILMQHHIDHLEQRGAVTQRWFIGFAVASIVIELLGFILDHVLK